MAGLVLGFLVGMAFGAVLQRGRFCMTATFRDFFLTRDTYLLRVAVLTVLFTAIGFYGAAKLGYIPEYPDVEPAGLHNVVGAFLFGLGIVLAGSCASGVLYRLGEGYTAALTAILGIFVGIAIYSEVHTLVVAHVLRPTNMGRLTLMDILGISPIWLILFLAIPTILFEARHRK